MRYERKYLSFRNEGYIFKKFLIKNNFRNIFDKRVINSIYFDTTDLKFFTENIEGISRRKKVRLRWYNNDFAKSILEIKNKKEFLVWKENFPININDDINFNFLNLKKNSLNKIYIFKKFNLIPKIKISYSREYFLSSCGNFRATVDTDLSMNRNLKSKILPHFMNRDILEFKYNQDRDTLFRNFVNDVGIKFRFQKYSKYVSGVLLLKNNSYI